MNVFALWFQWFDEDYDDEGKNHSNPKYQINHSSDNLKATVFELWFEWLNEDYDYEGKNHSNPKHQINHSSDKLSSTIAIL